VVGLDANLSYRGTSSFAELDPETLKAWVVPGNWDVPDVSTTARVVAAQHVKVLTEARRLNNAKRH
jgi:hypothetical protein